MEYIKIFWDDLSARKQQEILDAFGDNCNFDVFPIAEIPVEVEENPAMQNCVAITLIRNRLCENEQWANTIYLTLKSDEDPKQWKEILRSRIEAYLTTPNGWKDNCIACKDYNWGDFINNLPESVATFDAQKNVRIVACETLSVNQDELLAPEDVPALLIATKNGTIKHYPCHVNFTDGTVYHDQDCHEFDEAYVCLKTNNCCFACDPEEDYMKLKSAN